MKIRGRRFNTYLLIGLALAGLCGCRSTKGKAEHKESTLRVHAEALPDPSGRTQTVTVFREHPVRLSIQKEPFLTEAMVKEAKVVDTMGGFALELKLKKKGTWILEQASAGSAGRRFAIYSEFACPTNIDNNTARWLAAPKVGRRITDGVLAFTPDATREEAEQIARGLNYVAKKDPDYEPNW